MAYSSNKLQLPPSDEKVRPSRNYVYYFVSFLNIVVIYKNFVW